MWAGNESQKSQKVLPERETKWECQGQNEFIQYSALGKFQNKVYCWLMNDENFSWAFFLLKTYYNI